MRATVVIPARMASTRLPGKPLAIIAGEPMIVQVWRRAIEAEVGEVVVACAEKEIKEAVEKAGGKAVLTHPYHPSGSDRIWEAIQLCNSKESIILNVQGDLPTLSSDSIRKTLLPLDNKEVDIATLAAEIHSSEEMYNPNVVKIAFAATEQKGGWVGGRAHYFSRATIPAGDGPHYHHIGIYAYRREALEQFVSLPPAALEKRERLEQLRALEAGMRMDVALVDEVPLGVDTPEDLEKARKMLADR